MIVFPTNKPKTLLKKFEDAIKGGTIETWEKDSDGDYLHKSNQWKHRAWLRPEIAQGESLTFYVLISSDEPQRKASYAFHSTSIVGSFINHFDDLFGPAAQITPQMNSKDSIF